MSRPLFMLGARLSTCVKYVREGAILADVGTDHAYLPIWLLKSGRIKFAYASDIAEKPLMQAKSNAEKYEVTDSLKTICAPGLSAVPEDATDIVIAGMGGQMIIGILQSAERLKNEAVNLVLQPMKDEPLLRKWLFENGYYIKAESAVIDGGKVYTVINAAYTEKSLENISDIDFYIGKLETSNASRLYGEKTVRKLNKEIIGLKSAGDVKGIERLENIIKEIEEKYIFTGG